MKLTELIEEFERAKELVEPIMDNETTIPLYIVKYDSRFLAGDGVYYIKNDTILTMIAEEPVYLNPATKENLFEETNYFSEKKISMEHTLEIAIGKLKEWYHDNRTTPRIKTEIDEELSKIAY